MEKLTVLVVDDDREIVRAISITLEREGYQIARIPIGEMLWVLWRDNGTAAPE